MYWKYEYREEYVKKLYSNSLLKFDLTFRLNWGEQKNHQG
jgi:hypothetical protein